MNDRVLLTPPDRPTRVRLTSRDEIHAVALALLDTAQRTVRFLHRDLSAFDLARPAAVERLHRFLLASRNARVHLLLDNVCWFELHLPRLKLLQRQFSHAIEVRVANHEDPVGDDAALLIDEAHSLVLTRTAQGIGEVWFDNAPHAQPMVAGFERRWQSAGHNLAVFPLGL